jgi:hypothetical protein
MPAQFTTVQSLINWFFLKNNYKFHPQLFCSIEEIRAKLEYLTNRSLKSLINTCIGSIFWDTFLQSLFCMP